MTKARIALIGAGWWAVENHLPLLKQRQDVEIKGICTLGAQNLKKIQQAFDIPYGTEDYRQLLEHDELDGVVVSSPHVHHYEHACAAMKKGCHVLVEKPFATESAQARELIKIEKEKGVTIVVPFGYNFSELAAAAVAGRALIGNIRSGSVHMASATASLFRGDRVDWARGSLVEPEAATWADATRAGGFGWGQLSHALGLLFLLIEQPAESVFARTFRAPSGVDLFDTAVLCVAGGASIALSGSSGLAAGAKPQLSLRLFGDSGHLSLDFETESMEARSFDSRTLRPEFRKGAGAYSGRRPVELFVEVCLGRIAANPASGIIGCRSTEVLDALYRSAASGLEESV
jgi:predicted dehydrogenase